MSSGARAHAHRQGDGSIALETNLGSFDACDHPDLFAALAVHCGWEPEPLLQAMEPRGKKPDPRYPELDVLVEKARRDWDRHGAALVDALRAALDDGKLLPMSPETRERVVEILRQHRVGIALSFTGAARGLGLEAAGQAGAERSTVELAYRLGRAVDPTRPVVEPAPAGTLEEVVQRAVRHPLTPRDEAALEYAKTRAGIYMRKPVTAVQTEAERVLNEAEYSALREPIAEGAEAGWSAPKLARELKDAVQGRPTITNDMLRVARTELAFVHCHGAYVALKERAARGGDLDPLVYKLVHPRACDDCRRVWGPAGNPTKYRLSVIEQRDAAGGNFGLPRSQWGPVSGPMHPNCTEGPLQYWHPVIAERVEAAMAAFRRLNGG